MNTHKRESIEQAGFEFGDAADFLGLSPAESRLVDLHLAVARAVRRLRENHGLSQTELARRMGSSQSRIAKVEGDAPGVALNLGFRALFELGGTLEDLSLQSSDDARAATSSVVQHECFAKSGDRTIWVFGNGDPRPGFGFSSAEDFRRFIKEDLFRVHGGRYRHSQKRNAEVIVLCLKGLAYGRFDVESKERPTEQDLVRYDKAKQVYLVACATLYENPVRLHDLGIRVGHGGVELSEEQLVAIESHAGRLDRFQSTVECD